MNERGLYRLFKAAVATQLPNALYWKIPDTKGLGGKRLFDALLIHNGHAFCIEFKVGNRKPTPQQAYWLERAKRAGAYGIVLTEQNWRSFLRYIARGTPEEVQ